MLKIYLEPILLKVSIDSSNYNLCKQYLNILSQFMIIPSENCLNSYSLYDIIHPEKIKL